MAGPPEPRDQSLLRSVGSVRACVCVCARARACVCRELLTSRSNDPADRIVVGPGNGGACVGVEKQPSGIGIAAAVVPGPVSCGGASVAEPHPRGCDLALVLRHDVRKPRRLAVGASPPHVFSCKVRGTVVTGLWGEGGGQHVHASMLPPTGQGEWRLRTVVMPGDAVDRLQVGSRWEGLVALVEGVVKG